MTKIPANFDGEKFQKKYGLSDFTFSVENNRLVCETLPDLTEADLIDCIATQPEPITEIVYSCAIVATDFRVRSPKIPKDRKKAMQDAVKEGKKISKSVPFMTMANTHVLEGLLARVEELEAQLKKKNI